MARSASSPPVGLGGLGHMAVKLAHALGAKVSVLSQSLKKQEDGLRLGADHSYATSDADIFATLAGIFDLIINTVSADLDLDAYLGPLGAVGVLVNVGAPAKPLSLNAFSLLTNGRSITGSMIGGITETREMLDFGAEHGVGAEIETISADRINDAFERVLASDGRYRVVTTSPPSIPRTMIMQKLSKQPPTKGPAEMFTGDVYFDVIYQGDEPSRMRANVVRSAPCARTAWHTHAMGQTLHVTDGIGLVQSRGGDVVVMGPGDTVYTPPGEWHWHGAAPEHFIAHLALWEGPPRIRDSRRPNGAST
jgi:quercetin dioxygenase-like cupin family protein